MLDPPILRVPLLDHQKARLRRRRDRRLSSGSSSRHGASRLARELARAGTPVAELHGDRADPAPQRGDGRHRHRN